MAETQFEATIDAWVQKSEDRMLMVMRESVQDVVDKAQLPKAKGGRMPVDTGFLRNSLISGLNGSFSASGASSYALIIAGMDLGDEARFAWTAAYAFAQHFGSGGRAGNFWVDYAVEDWQGIVDRNTARAKARFT